MERTQWFLSTTACDCVETAAQWGLGLELADFCTPWNLDDEFDAADACVRQRLAEVPRCLLHGPFNELFPCAIDRKARALADFRYRQSAAIARRYGAQKIIFHGGYHPWIYYPVWYVEQSILFWKDFLRENPGITVVLENVLEEDPLWLRDIIAGVDAPELRMCLDVGHVNAYSPVPPEKWIEVCAPFISHFHIHNNDGTRDSHQALFQGSMDMTGLLEQIQAQCPRATLTLELTEAAPSVRWLAEKQWI